MRKFILVAIVLAAFAGAAAAQDAGLDRLAGKDTFVYAAVDGTFAKDLGTSAVYKVATDPALRAFLQGIESQDPEFRENLGKVLDFPDKFQKKTGGPLMDAAASVGEIALAVLRFDRDNPDIVVTMDLKGNEKLESLLMEQLGAAGNRRTIEGVDVVEHKKTLVGKVKGLLFFASNENVVRMLAKPPTDSLAASKRYAHARASVQAGKSSLFVYCNVQPILPELLKEAQDPTAKTLLDIAGLDRIGYAAASVRFENAQVVLRAHFNADLDAAPYAIDPAIFERKPADIRKDPSIKMVSLSQSDEGQGLRNAFQSLLPIFAMAAQQNGFGLDPAAFPINLVAGNAGVARDAAVLTSSGLSYVGRSNLGMSMSGSGGGSAAGAGVLSALMMPAIVRATQRAKATSCANNLSQLWKMQNIYMSQFGGRARRMPEAMGTDFWLALTRTDPPLIDPSFRDIFVCPLSRKRGEACSYAGPDRDVFLAEDGDPVGLCDDPAHGETVIILRKSGDVHEVSRHDPLYQEALEKTTR